MNTISDLPTVAVVGHDYNLLVMVPAELTKDNEQQLGVFTMGRSVLKGCLSAGSAAQEFFIVPSPQWEPLQDIPPHFPLLTLQWNKDKKSPRVNIQGLEIVHPFEPKLDNCPITAIASGKPTPFAFTRVGEDVVDLDICVIYWNANWPSTKTDRSSSTTLSSTLGSAIPRHVLLHLAANYPIDEKDVKSLRDELFTFVEEHHRRTTVITNASSLGHLGVRLRYDGSWENFADDLQQALNDATSSQTEDPNNSTILGELSRCLHVIVRSGDSAIALYERRASPVPASDVNAEPHPMRIFYPVDKPVVPMTQSGFLVGGTSLLTSSLVESLARGINKKEIEEGIRNGVMRCEVLGRNGYAKKVTSPATGEVKILVNSNWHRDICKAVPQKPNDSVWYVEVAPRGPWSITQQILGRVEGGKPNAQDHSNKARRAFDIAKSAVTMGVEKAAREHGFPLAKIGDTIVVDRTEFEQYTAMKIAMQSYLKMASQKGAKPLSLSVFGKPGAGKSRGIKQLLKIIAGGLLQEKPIEANVSQFQSKDDLAVILHQARDVALDGLVPVVLWDEFDSQWEDRAFGWFRSFLAPMQDGTFQQGQSTYKIGRAIFVFIGGVNHNFDMFEGRMRDHDFIEAKGPDFISRLRGYLNVLSLADPCDGDQMHVLRRAVYLRYFLLQYQRPAVFRHREPSDEEYERIRIANDVLKAFLTVKDYKHGVRSFEAIVQMCHIASGQQQMTWSSLPPPEQLESHVSAREFREAGRIGW